MRKEIDRQQLSVRLPFDGVPNAICSHLQVDGYAGFERLTERGDIVLAACWAHTRRKFFDVHEATGSPIAAEALRRIAELYAIEKSIRGRTAEERRSVRD